MNADFTPCDPIGTNSSPRYAISFPISSNSHRQSHPRPRGRSRRVIEIGWLKSCHKGAAASLQDWCTGVFGVNALPERLMVKGPKLSRHSIAGNTFDAFEAFLHEIGAQRFVL